MGHGRRLRASEHAGFPLGNDMIALMPRGSYTVWERGRSKTGRRQTGSVVAEAQGALTAGRRAGGVSRSDGLYETHRAHDWGRPGMTLQSKWQLGES